MVRIVSWIATLAFSTVTAFRPGDEVCVISKDNSCSVNKLMLSQTDASTLIYPGGKTRCAFDDFSSNLTQYKTNATYFFQVFPKKQSNKLLLYLQGGGACTGPQTCNFETQCSVPMKLMEPNARALSEGILNASDPNNVFRDWNIVHLPYCTGDLHIGNNVTDTNDAVTIFSEDSCSGKKLAMHMNGYENAMAALNWAVTNYPNPDQLVLSGSSAGALGAQLLSNKVAALWKIEESKTKFAVLADSYVGVTDDGTVRTLFDYFGACDLITGFPDSLVAKCKSGTATVIEMTKTLISQTLFSDLLHIDSKADQIQRGFETLFKVGIDAVLETNVTAPGTFFDQMMLIIKGEQDTSTRVSTFLVDGENHVFFNRPDWYSIQRSETNETLGPFVKSWLELNAANDGTNDDKTRVPKPNNNASKQMLQATTFIIVATLFTLL